MIDQATLTRIHDGQRLLREAEADPMVKAYLAAQREQKAEVDKLRERVKLREPIEAGPLSVEDKTQVSVQWERVWAMIREDPKISKVIATCRAVQLLLKRLADRDVTAPFITVSHTVSVIEVPTPGPEPSE